MAQIYLQYGQAPGPFRTVKVPTRGNVWARGSSIFSAKVPGIGWRKLHIDTPGINKPTETYVIANGERIPALVML